MLELSEFVPDSRVALVPRNQEDGIPAWSSDVDRHTRGQAIPLRTGEPDEIAAAVAFLVSDDARYITGQTVVVDGALLSQQRSPR